MRAWIDQDLCTGDGLCTDHCPEVFVLLDDGISYVHDGDAVGNDPGGAASTVLVPATSNRQPSTLPWTAPVSASSSSRTS